MAKNNKADMSCARVKKYTASDVSKAERHNERKNETYENMNVIEERIPFNVHFKTPTAPTYMEQLKQMETDGLVSLRGLRKDATIFNEIVIDVNTMYFERNGGYEYAKQFYEEAFHFIEEKFGAENVISAVMHADEINIAATEELGKEVYHYHLHAILLYSILKEEKKTKGKARLTSMLRSGKELKVFTVKNGDLKKFTQEAKKYGVLYCVLTDRKNKDPNAEVDVIARAEDASKISRIVERFNLASVDTASIVTEAEKSKDAKDGQPEPDIGVQEKAEKDKLLDELMGKPVQKEENAPNPSVAKTEKSPQSEPTLEQPKKSAEGATMTKEKPSVREELRKIKESRKEQEAEIGTSDLDKSGASDRAKSANRKTEHKQPTRKKKKPKSKETR